MGVVYGAERRIVNRRPGEWRVTRNTKLRCPQAVELNDLAPEEVHAPRPTTVRASAASRVTSSFPGSTCTRTEQVPAHRIECGAVRPEARVDDRPRRGQTRRGLIQDTVRLRDRLAGIE